MFQTEVARCHGIGGRVAGGEQSDIYCFCFQIRIKLMHWIFVVYHFR